SGLGISAARPVSREELRHFDLAVGRDYGSAGAVPLRGGSAPGRRSPTTSASHDLREFRVRYHSRGVAAPRELARTGSPEPRKFPLDVLDTCADDRPSFIERLPASRWVPDRQWHRLRAREEQPRVPAGIDLEGERTAAVTEW